MCKSTANFPSLKPNLFARYYIYLVSLLSEKSISLIYKHFQSAAVYTEFLYDFRIILK